MFLFFDARSFNSLGSFAKLKSSNEVFPPLLIWQVTKITLKIMQQEHSDLPAVILVMSWDLESTFIFIILNLLPQFGVFLG